MPSKLPENPPTDDLVWEISLTKAPFSSTTGTWPEIVLAAGDILFEYDIPTKQFFTPDHAVYAIPSNYVIACVKPKTVWHPRHLEIKEVLLKALGVGELNNIVLL